LSIFDYLVIPAILRGVLGILAAGTFYPVAGVYVLRFNLYTFRFTIMHAVFLASAAALALRIDALGVSLLACILITLLLAPVSRAVKIDVGMVSALFMVLTIAAAVTIMYRAQVPAKDALEILWGNVYAMSDADIVFTAAFSLVPIGFTLLFYRQVSCLLFDREIAYTTGVNDSALMNAIMVITGMTIAFIMRLIGALLIDALLILPALAAMKAARSTKSLFLASICIGFVSSLAGFVLSLAVDIPASAGVSIAAGIIFVIIVLIKIITSRRSTA
jgi:zinc transport system permease protein